MRIKQGLKDKILIMNASMPKGGSRDYFSFAKKFREMDLNSDGGLDRDEFRHALGPKGMNLGLPARDIRHMFNEFSNGGDNIDCKQFLSGMAELDRPDPIWSLCCPRKERALTVLMDRILDDQLSKSP